MKNYYKALGSFQQECPVLLNNTKGHNYHYIKLSKLIFKINPLMKKYGLGFTQKLGTNKETGNTSLTTVIFHKESGEFDSATVDIPIVELRPMNKYQSLGAGITYFKRYQLSAQLGIASDDDTDAFGTEINTPNEAVKNNDTDLPWLTDSQFQATLKSNKEQAVNVLASFKMKKEYKTQINNKFKI